MQNYEAHSDQRSLTQSLFTVDSEDDDSMQHRSAQVSVDRQAFDSYAASVATSNSATTIVFKQSSVQTPILDPMAPSAAIADDYWRDTLSMQAMWSAKLLLVLCFALMLCLFVQAKGDPLAVHLVSSISVLCMLFYIVRIQSRVAHTDRIVLVACCAWISYSSMTAFNGRVVDHVPKAYLLRDMALYIIVALFGIRYWVMMDTEDKWSLHEKPLLTAIYRVWTAPNAWVVFAADYRTNDTSGHNSNYNNEDRTSASSKYGHGSTLHSGNSFSDSAYQSVSLRTVQLEQSQRASYDVDDNKLRRHRPVSMLHRLLGSIVSLLYDALYWAYAVACALPLHNNNLFVEPTAITVARSLLFVIIYMISDSMMDPATDVAAIHVGPTMLIVTSYVFFVSPWMLWGTALHLSVLFTYVLLHAYMNHAPWMQWASFDNLRRKFPRKQESHAEIQKEMFDSVSTHEPLTTEPTQNGNY